MEAIKIMIIIRTMEIGNNNKTYRKKKTQQKINGNYHKNNHEMKIMK